MKILVIGKNLEKIIGGAELSLGTLVKYLSDKNSVMIYNYASENAEDSKTIKNWKMPNWLKKLYLPKRLKFLWNHNLGLKNLHKLIDEYQPELIISQKPPIPVSFNAIPTLAFVRDLEYIDFFLEKNNRTPKGKINYFLEKKIGKKIISELKKVDLVISNSSFAAHKLEKFGIEAEYIYPFIDITKNVCGNRNPEYITFVANEMSIHKGFDIFMKIVEEMSNTKFLAAGRNSYNLLTTIPANLNYIGWTNNIRDVYSKTKLLLVPSICEESFGRVAVEAQANGIPVIASKIGGLPESVGDGGILIDDYKNPQKWINTIRELLNSKTLMDKLSEKALKRSKNFDAKYSYEKLKHLIEQKLNLEI